MKSKLIQRKLEGPKVSTEELQGMAAQVSQVVAEAVKEVEAPATKEDLSLMYTAYDVVRDTEKGGNNFIAVEIKYNLKTKKTSIISKPFHDKTAGMSMFMDKDNRKYLFEKNRRVKR